MESLSWFAPIVPGKTDASREFDAETQRGARRRAQRVPQADGTPSAGR